MKKVRIATRGSDLALAQAEYIAARIQSELGAETELVVIKTTGDRIQNVSLAKIGGKGLFVKEIEEALLEGRADVAIHSAKDLPAVLAPDLTLAAFPERVDPRDALVARETGATLSALPRGARIGTGSTRRTSQILALRPDLEIVPLRGNVPTRIGKIESENLAAVVLACAGLDRLQRSSVISERISTDLLLPAVCQGALALEARDDDPLVADLASLTEPDAEVAVAAERSFLRRLEGDCTVPLAAFCERTSPDLIRLRGLVASADGGRIARAERVGPPAEAARLGEQLAEAVLEAGGGEILEQLRREGAEGAPP